MNTCRHTTPQKLSISDHYRVEKEFGKMSNLNLQIRQLHYTPSTWVKKPWLYMGSLLGERLCVFTMNCVYTQHTLTPRLLTHVHTHVHLHPDCYILTHTHTLRL